MSQDPTPTPAPTPDPPTDPTTPADARPATAAESPSPDGPQVAPTPVDAPDLDVAQIATVAAARRTPRYGRWVLVGVLIGAIAAALPAILGPPGVILGRGTIFLLLFLGLGMAGALLGALAALVVERRATPRPAAGRPRRARARG